MDLSGTKTQIVERGAQGGHVAPIEVEPVRRLPRAPVNGLAMSLERRRLQFYLALVLADALLILGSFAASILI